MKFQNNKQNMGKISAEILQKVVVHDFLWHPVLVSPVFFQISSKNNCFSKARNFKKNIWGGPTYSAGTPGAGGEFIRRMALLGLSREDRENLFSDLK